MRAILFDVPAQKLFFVTPKKRWLPFGSRKRKYEHSFGGPPRHEGVTQPGLDRPAHLLYMFDLRDPALGLELPGVRWLPIYYARGAGAISYRVVSDSRIELLHPPYSEYDLEHGTLDNFPPPLPQVPVRLRAAEYDPHDPEDVVLLGKIFGLGDLSAEEKAWVKSRIEEDYHRKRGRELTNWGEEPFESLEDVADWFAGGYGQGFLEGHCPNLQCKNRKVKEQSQALLVVDLEPEDGPLYQEIEDLGGERLVYEICPRCHAIGGFVPIT